MVPADQKAHENIESDTTTCVRQLRDAAEKDGIAPGARFVVSARLQEAIDKVKNMVSKWKGETHKQAEDKHYA